MCPDFCNEAYGMDVGDGRTGIQRVPPKARRVRFDFAHPCFQGEAALHDPHIIHSKIFPNI